MRLKKLKGRKDETIKFRLTSKEEILLKKRAMLYCGGNVSEFIRYAITNFFPVISDMKGAANNNGPSEKKEILP